MYRRFFKSLMDYVICVPVFILLLPLFVLIAFLLMIANEGSGIFYLQERPGKGARIFRVIKFKTMTDKCDSEGKLLPDADRLTRTGKLLRSFSLDEIPQLINVLKGEMSLIGPRPLLIKYLPLYNSEQARRHEVKPGITGWAQVNGRNENSWSRKLELDIWYVDNLSIGLDFKIILMSVKKVLLKEGVNRRGEATTVAFNGKN
jgi:undecaprenyl phosphate N,N'-diacetylbacillosamine 1-phosphate transferase